MPDAEEAGEGEEGAEENVTSNATVKAEAIAECEPWDGIQTSHGWWDGTRYYLRNFAVWYRWREVPLTSVNESLKRPESGNVDGVDFVQSMGRIQLTYDLIGADEQLTDEDLIVEMASWELRVSKGSSNNNKAKNLPKINALTGELRGDIRRDLSWWEVVDNDPSWPGRHIVISLAKLNNYAWPGLWWQEATNPHKKASFGWGPAQATIQIQKKMQSAEEVLEVVPPGAPQDLEKDLCTATPPEKLCTGTSFKEDNATITLFVYLDEEQLDLASAICPLEELFSADVEANFLEVSLRGDGFGLVWGELADAIVPEMTLWDIGEVKRYTPKNPAPKEYGIPDPTFYCKALRIVLTKAVPSTWGKVFTKMESTTFSKPQTRMPWTDRVMRALVLSPCAVMNDRVKAERAAKLCTSIDTSQDNVLHRAYITIHLEERLEGDCYKFKLPVDTAFSMKIHDSILEINFVADNAFTICMGKLGGNVMPEKTSWEITKVDNHLALKIGLTKAKGSQVPWDEVYVKVKPWEIVDLQYQKLQAMEDAQ